MVKRAVKKELAKKIKWLKKLKSILTFRKLLPTIENTFSDLVSNNTDTVIELHHENKDAKTDYQEVVRVGDHK